MKFWDDTERSVTLTNKQWLILSAYLRMTERDRIADVETWERLAMDTNTDGTPKYEFAADDARFCNLFLKEINQIQQIIGQY